VPPQLEPDDDLHRAQQALLSDIAARVVAAHAPGLPSPRRVREPLDALIETILNQQNTRSVTERQYAALRAAFPTWTDALHAGSDVIEDTLRAAGGGLARVKADYIWNVLHAIAERGPLTLQGLYALTDDEARSTLEALPGVGMKTASAVLLFDMLRPAMPVDTNILRVTRRLALLPLKWSTHRVERWYDGALPRTWRDRYAFHVGMIRHGRHTCTPKRPACPTCVLADLCPSAPVFLGSDSLNAGER